MKKFKFLTLSAAVIAIGAFSSGAAKADDHSHDLKNAAGEVVGTVAMKETASGVLLNIDLKGLEAGGSHAVHIHETGKCDPDFTAAGGHFNPAGHNHGMMDEKGQHAGDMPNLHVAADGAIKQEILNTMITTNAEDTADGRHSIHDVDGSAIIIHEGTDDYTSQPTGEAGGRMACAVLAEPKE